MKSDLKALTLAAAFGLSLPALCFAQGQAAPGVTVSGDPEPVSGDDAPEWMQRLAVSPDSPRAKAHAEQVKARKQAEKELRKIRMKHFGRIKAQSLRQEGLVKLHDYAKPELFPLLIDLFKDDGADVRLAVLDMFAQAKSVQGDTALAWVAVLDQHAEYRSAASERLATRLTKDGSAPDQIKYVIYEGMRSGKNESMVSAAKLAAGLNLIDVMPWLINAQVVGQPTQQVVGGGANGSGQGALAWIMVGQQTAFVSDLVPVVGPNAVAFDPQLSVVNTGVILRVLDAAVVTYHVDIHNALVDWSSREFGSSTNGLGYNIPAWREWYAKEFVPQQARKAAEQAERDRLEQEKSKSPAIQPGSPSPTAPGSGSTHVK